MYSPGIEVWLEKARSPETFARKGIKTRQTKRIGRLILPYEAYIAT
jgi:hypothetical protein